jgi:hypothetical protein
MLGRMEWDVERLADHVRTRRAAGLEPREELMMEENLRIFFPQAEPKLSSEPSTVIDMHGNILVWYLPRILGSGRIVSLIVLSPLMGN